MPVLPYRYYSNYYVGRMYFYRLFEDLGIENTLPDQPILFLAKQLQSEVSNDASKALLVQGQAGYQAQDVKPLVYTYTIVAPLIIPADNTTFFPYNCLNYFAAKLANWQWQQLNGYDTSLISSENFYVLVEKYSITADDSGVNQTLVIKSNRSLFYVDNPDFYIDAFNIEELYYYNTDVYNDVANFSGRLAKNYDIYVDTELQQINDNGTFGTPYYLAWSPQAIFLKSLNFEISFDIENKNLVNTGTLNIFLLKNYDIKYSYSIAGRETETSIALFDPGRFAYYDTISRIALASIGLLAFRIPMIVKKKSFLPSADQLYTTELDFSFYGTSFEPGTGPYGNDLFQSALS